MSSSASGRSGRCGRNGEGDGLSRNVTNAIQSQALLYFALNVFGSGIITKDAIENQTNYVAFEVKATCEQVGKHLKGCEKHFWEIPCSDGPHNSFWKSTVQSPEWKAWYEYNIGPNHQFDVDECQEVGWISSEHFAAFIKFTIGHAKKP